MEKRIKLKKKTTQILYIWECHFVFVCRPYVRKTVEEKKLKMNSYIKIMFLAQNGKVTKKNNKENHFWSVSLCWGFTSFNFSDNKSIDYN